MMETQIEELEPRIAPTADAAFMDSVIPAPKS